MAQCFVQPPVLGDGARQLHRRAQRGQHAFRRERLLEELERAELGGAHGVGQVGLAAHHHDGDVGSDPLELLQRREPVRPARHGEIEEHRIRPLALDRLDRRGPVGRLHGVEPLRLQQRADHPADVGFVVDQQDTRAHDADSTTVNVAPPPGVSDTVITPRWASTVWRTSASPRPVPSGFVVK